MPHAQEFAHQIASHEAVYAVFMLLLLIWESSVIDLLKCVGGDSVAIEPVAANWRTSWS